MKDLVQIWNRVTGKQYAVVNSADRELKEFSNNRIRQSDIDTSVFEANLAECETLNNRFNNEDFNDKKDAIINRLFERRRQGQMTRQPKCIFLLLMLGFFGLGAGCFILLVHPYDILFKLKVVLSEGGEIFEMWRKPEVDLYVRIFLFNVTNADQFMAGNDSVLRVKEVGPYVYKEALEHTNVSFNGNDTLTSIPKHPLTWVGELSEGHKEDDVLYLANIAVLSIANVVSKQGLFTRFGLNRLISATNSQPLLKMTAKEFMMGHESELVTLGNQFMPGWIYFDKLGLIDRMYDFNGDFETIYTGADDVRLSGLIDTYRGSQDLPQWHGQHCSNVRYASDGTKFKGGLGRNDSILFYRKSLCRAAPLVSKEEGVKSGLKAYMFTFPENMLDNGKYIEENKCFCRDGKCLPAGLIDVTDCYYGFPIALSYPHFYKGSDELFNKIEGLTPSKEQHETRFWIQPDSGLPLDVSAKFQINMALDDLSSINNVGRFSNLYLPLLWFDIRMYSLPVSMEERFKLYLNVLPVVEKVAMYSLFIIGSILVLTTVYRLAFKIMFKTFDSNKKSNIAINTDMWMDREKNGNSKNDVYAPCEISLNDTQESSSDEIVNNDRRPSLMKTQTDKIKDLGLRISDKVKVDFNQVKSIFKGNKMETCTNDGFNNSSDDDYFDDCKYLEVIDDDLRLNEPVRKKSFKENRVNELDSVVDHDLIIELSD